MSPLPPEWSGRRLTAGGWWGTKTSSQSREGGEGGYGDTVGGGNEVGRGEGVPHCDPLTCRDSGGRNRGADTVGDYSHCGHASSDTVVVGGDHWGTWRWDHPSVPRAFLYWR